MFSQTTRCNPQYCLLIFLGSTNKIETLSSGSPLYIILQSAGSFFEVLVLAIEVPLEKEWLRQTTRIEGV